MSTALLPSLEDMHISIFQALQTILMLRKNTRDVEPLPIEAFLWKRRIVV